ncbi:MAG TPA: hypothetical protein VIZ32_02790, partial [Vicinamibacterales bacterium]
AVRRAACVPPRPDERGDSGPYRGRGSDAATLLIVHVSSHWRHRQSVVSVMTFASVSKTVPLQAGQ